MRTSVIYLAVGIISCQELFVYSQGCTPGAAEIEPSGWSVQDDFEGEDRDAHGGARTPLEHQVADAQA